MTGYVLRHGEELYHTVVEGVVKGRRPQGRPRNSHISQLKKNADINTYAGLKRLAEEIVKMEDEVKRCKSTYCRLKKSTTCI